MEPKQLAEACAERMMARDRASRSLGIEVSVTAPGSVTARMTVRDDMLNGFDVLHGGLLFALADTAFAFACNAYNQQTVAAAAQIEMLRPAVVGDKLSATAVEEHRGRRSGHYTVRVENQDGALVALFRGRGVGSDKPLISDT